METVGKDGVGINEVNRPGISIRFYLQVNAQQTTIRG